MSEVWVVWVSVTIKSITINALYMNRMSSKEYEETVRYHIFHLLVYPLIIIFSILIVGQFIESGFGYNLKVAKIIFSAIGGIGYFIWYFRKQLGRDK